MVFFLVFSENINANEKIFRVDWIFPALYNPLCNYFETFPIPQNLFQPRYQKRWKSTQKIRYFNSVRRADAKKINIFHHLQKKIQHPFF